MTREYRKAFLTFLLIAGFPLTALFSGCAIISSGTAGIEWAPTKGTIKKALPEGFHIISPFAHIYHYDLRVQERQENLEVQARDGLTILLDVSVLYRPNPSRLYQLQTSLGINYFSVLIHPLLGSAARKVVGQFSPEDVYSKQRREVEKEILEELRAKLEGQPIFVDAVVIRTVRLPRSLMNAIDLKLQEQQRALMMTYVLQREQQEAKRKQIEATGIANYQDIISKTLTPELLEWKEIDAMQKLSLSPNGKTLVIAGGQGKGSLPLIINPGKEWPGKRKIRRERGMTPGGAPGQMPTEPALPGAGSSSGG